MLNKIFLAIKTWILLQLTNLKNWWLSLFKEKAEQDNLKPSDAVELDSEREDFFNEIDIEYRDLPSIENYIQENEPQPSDTTAAVSTLEKALPEIEAPPVSAEPAVPQLSHSLMESAHAFLEKEEAVLPPPEPVIPLYDGKYDDIFSTTETAIPSSIVNEEVWNVIKEQLPEGYSIPAPTSLAHYKRKQ